MQIRHGRAILFAGLALTLTGCVSNPYAEPKDVVPSQTAKIHASDASSCFSKIDGQDPRSVVVLMARNAVVLPGVHDIEMQREHISGQYRILYTRGFPFNFEAGHSYDFDFVDDSLSSKYTVTIEVTDVTTGQTLQIAPPPQ